MLIDSSDGCFYPAPVFNLVAFDKAVIRFWVSFNRVYLKFDLELFYLTLRAASIRELVPVCLSSAEMHKAYSPDSNCLI